MQIPRSYLLKTGAVLLILVLCAAPAPGQKSFDENLLEAFSYRELGPAKQGGRILHVAVPRQQPFTFYVSPASGGLWKTVNNGITFEPLFQNEEFITIGDVMVAASDPNILWIGTGTPASGRLSLLGGGVYKSIDAGVTWNHMGLRETIHIGKLAIHPGNPDIVFVAALGYHFSQSGDRGIFRTVDGGRNWSRVLTIEDRVGFVDVVINPVNPDVVYAASYDKRRIPWHFEDGGPESGIFKSQDGGDTWEKLRGGLPSGKLGRIGIALYSGDPDILYANITNANKRPPTEQEIRRDKAQGRKPEDRPLGGEVWRSENAGRTWRKMNADTESVGGGKWTCQIRIHPENDQVIYVAGVNMHRSLDGGKTWDRRNFVSGVHVDHHELWIDPDNPEFMINGNDGGLAITCDGGRHWDAIETLPLAQFYAIGVDMEEPFNIYGGLQDNGSIKLPSNGRKGFLDEDDWVETGGGDGMYNVVDPEDSRWLYNDSQFGYISRVDQKTGLAKMIRPSREKGAEELRFNWCAPIHISPHNPRIIYIGAQVLFRSLNRGDDWEEISPDLSGNDPEKLAGNIEFCTITTISESPVRAGIIWVGTDDGKVQVTLDHGGTWTDVTRNLPAPPEAEDFYVGRVFASSHKAGRAYAVKSGYQRDDFRPFVFRTDDYGHSWAAIQHGLPQGRVHVIVEDRKNPDLLFLGAEQGVFVTIDGGGNWVQMQNNMPRHGLVHDLLIHPRDNDLVVATHARGIWMTDISPLQEVTPELLEKDVYLFKVEPGIPWRWRSAMSGAFHGDRHFVVKNEPVGLKIHYYLKRALPEKVTVFIRDIEGREIISLKGAAAAGINRLVWNMRGRPDKSSREEGLREPRPGSLVPPGEVLVVLEAAGETLTTRAKIRPMPEK